MTNIILQLNTVQDQVPNSSNDLKHLYVIANAIRTSKRCVVVTGAGISVSGGIPDFRSNDGLYNLVKAKYPNTLVKGKDLFDATLFKDPSKTKVFYTFMGELKELIAAAHVTPTHRFLKDLEDQNHLLRCYTQNIDGMEERLGMSCDLEQNKTASAAARVVPLHGDLNTLKCSLCKSKYIFSQSDVNCFKGGSAPSCPKCLEQNELRTALGQREVAIGLLHPNLVMYNEYHESGDLIADLTARDIRKRPDLLIVMGTSLNVHGIQLLVKDLAQTVHALKRGKVILINRVELAQSKWNEIFDYHIKSDSDDAVIALAKLVDELNTNTIKKVASRQLLDASISMTGATTPILPIRSGRAVSPANDHEKISRHGLVLVKRVLVGYDQWWCRLLDATSEEEKSEVFKQKPRHLAYRLQRFAKAYLAPKGATDRNCFIEKNLNHMSKCPQCNTISKLVENRGKTDCKRKNVE